MGGEFGKLVASLAVAFVGVPVAATGLGQALRLEGVAQAALGFFLLQITLGATGYAGLRRIGPGWQRPWGRPWARGLARGPLLALLQLAVTAAVVGLLRLAGFGAWAAEVGRQEEEQPSALLFSAGPAMAAVVAGLLVVGAPIAEELFFRGYFYGLLRRRAGMAAVGAAALSGLGFAALHGYVVHLPALWLSGLLLAIWYEASGHLAVPIGAHMSFNALTLALAALERLPGHS